MIQELLDLSQRLNLTGRQAFGMRPVHWIIELDAEGRLLGVVPTVTSTRPKSRKREQQPGTEMECPLAFFATVRPHGVIATGGGGNAVTELGAGNIGEIFGISIEARSGDSPRATLLPEDDVYRHTDFLDLHRQLAESAPGNQIIQAVWRFLSTHVAFPIGEFAVSQLNILAGQQFSFRVAGRLLLQDRDLRRWWKREFARRRADAVEFMSPGRDLFPHAAGDPCTGVLTPVFPGISGIPGSGARCPLASFARAPFRSFGLGRGTLPMRLETAERSGAALNWLLRNASSHLQLGNTVAVFWATSTRDSSLPPQAVGFAELMAEPDPLQVRKFLMGAWGRQPCDVEEGRFYAAVLSSPQARISVRAWHVETLSRVRQNLQRWFASIAVPDPFGPGDVYPSIAELAACTVRNRQESLPLPGTYAALFESALLGISRMPSKLLAQALIRQRLELVIGSDTDTRADFERRLSARTALLQVYLRPSPGEAMPTAPVDLETNLAYTCGRLLAHLDRIYDVAYRISAGRHTSPATRAYAAASTTPALIFPHLCKQARYHLKKIGGGLAYRLEFGRQDAPAEGLCGIMASLREGGLEFPRTLSLEEQGRFAIGFYTERRRRWTKDPETTDRTASAK
jgi:CRISPR-associated protein Csd1